MRHTGENDQTKLGFDLSAAAPASTGESLPTPPAASTPMPPGEPDESPTRLEAGDALPRDPVPSSDDIRLSTSRYEVIRPIGEGGMGTVYLGLQHTPIRREVAIKVVRKGPEVERFKRRFVNERQALSRLDHPHIAQFIDAGNTAGGRPYFVMEYVPGVPITQFCDYHQLDLRDRLNLFIQVCDAVAHAHTKAIIHRDLKPSNVLAYLENDVATVKVIDFGLAKVIKLSGEGHHQTKLGAVIGSSYYMSPEQAIGLSDIDTRSDVYSLGVILYELILGAKPHDRSMYPHASELEFLQIISSRPAPGPSSRLELLKPEEREKIARRRQVTLPQFQRVLAKELEWIPLKAMRIERERRYGSAEELAADIRRYLQGEPLLAGPESWRYVASKWLERYRTAVAAAAVALLVLIGLASVGMILYFVSEDRQRRLNDTLVAVVAQQAQTDERLAAELSARLAADRQALLRAGNVAEALPLQRLYFPAQLPSRPPEGRVGESLVHVPLTEIAVENQPTPISTLKELVAWGQAQAATRFAGLDVSAAMRPVPVEEGSGLVLSETLNAVPFVECERDGESLRVKRLLLFVFCRNEADFDAQAKPAIRMLRDADGTPPEEPIERLRGTFGGTSRVDVQYVPTMAGVSWGWVAIHPRSE